MKIFKKLLHFLITIIGPAASQPAALLATPKPSPKIYAPQPPVPAPTAYNRYFNAFSELRNEVLNIIGSSQHRIWLVTEYLTDGEVVAALYLAKYRNIEVKVLLDRRFANHYMSRLAYLRQQNIAVYIKPESFYPGPTALLVDSRLFRINSDLNFMTARQSFNIRLASHTQAKTFANKFSQAIKSPIPAISRPKSAWTAPSRAPTPTHNGTYNYDRRGPRKIPNGVPSKLPSTTIFQQKQKQQVEQELNK